MAIRQPATLYSTVLKNYTYEEIRNLCFTEGSTFPSAFSCDWDIWRDKAVTDFNISPQFFDLIRVLSGPQRYLQVASYFKLTPLSGVRMYEGSIIEGVYEAFKGYEIAQKRRDGDMVLWFFNRLKPEARKQVKSAYSVLLELKEKKAVEARLSISEPFEEEEDKYFYLIEATKKGRVDILDHNIHDLFRLPKDFSISRDVPKHGNYNNANFWKKKGYLLDLPLQELDEDIEDTFLEKLLEASLESGDTRIADFYLSIFRNKKEEIKKAARKTRFGYDSLLLHGNPEDAYSIALRTLRYKKTYDDLPFHIVEVAFYLMQKHYESQGAFLISHLGDVASIMAILPVCSEEDVTRALNVLDEVRGESYKYLYPLSTMLLKQHYQTL
nr:hypothetical protein Cbor_178 [Cedratvirus borely]